MTSPMSLEIRFFSALSASLCVVLLLERFVARLELANGVADARRAVVEALRDRIGIGENSVDIQHVRGDTAARARWQAGREAYTMNHAPDPSHPLPQHGSRPARADRAGRRHCRVYWRRAQPRRVAVLRRDRKRGAGAAGSSRPASRRSPERSSRSRSFFRPPTACPFPRCNSRRYSTCRPPERGAGRSVDAHLPGHHHAGRRGASGGDRHLREERLDEDRSRNGCDRWGDRAVGHRHQRRADPADPARNADGFDYLRRIDPRDRRHLRSDAARTDGLARPRRTSRGDHLVDRARRSSLRTRPRRRFSIACSITRAR